MSTTKELLHDLANLLTVAESALGVGEVADAVSSVSRATHLLREWRRSQSKAGQTITVAELVSLSTPDSDAGLEVQVNTRVASEVLAFEVRVLPGAPELITRNVVYNAVTAKASRLVLEVSTFNGCVVLTYADNGVGMDHTTLCRIGMLQSGPGQEVHGLGTRIIHRNVFDMGANAHWRSILNIGTEVSIQYPATRKTT